MIFRRVPVLKKSCCGCSLSTGTLIIAIHDLVLITFQPLLNYNWEFSYCWSQLINLAFIAILYGVQRDARLEGNSLGNSLALFYMTDVKIGIATCFLLYWALYNRSRKAALPWLIISFLEMLLYLILLVAAIAGSYHFSAYHLGTIMRIEAVLMVVPICKWIYCTLIHITLIITECIF